MRLGDRLAAVCGLAYDLDLGLGLEDHSESGADERLVVDDQNAHDPGILRAGQLVLMAGERRRPMSGRAQGRKPSFEPGHRKLVDPDGTVEVLQQLRAEVEQLEALELLLL